MYNQNEFKPLGLVNELEKFKADYVYSADMTPDQCVKTINHILERSCTLAEVIVVTSIYSYCTDDNKLTSVTLNIRPSKRVTYVEGLATKRSFTVSDTLFIDVIDFLFNWLEIYHLEAMATENLKEFEADIAEVLADNNIDYKVKFELGTGILSATDKEITLGVDYDIASKLSEIPLYFKEFERSAELYKEEVVKTFESLNHVTDIVKQRNLFTKSVNIYSKRTIKKLLRASYSVKAAAALNKVGYYEDGDTFALVDVRVCNSKQLAEFKEQYGEDNVIVKDNETPHASDYILATNANIKDAIKSVEAQGLEHKEAKVGERTRIITGLYIAKAYCLKPFNVTTGEAVELELSKI